MSTASRTAGAPPGRSCTSKASSSGGDVRPAPPAPRRPAVPSPVSSDGVPRAVRLRRRPPRVAGPPSRPRSRRLLLVEVPEDGDVALLRRRSTGRSARRAASPGRTPRRPRGTAPAARGTGPPRRRSTTRRRRAPGTTPLPRAAAGRRGRRPAPGRTPPGACRWLTSTPGGAWRGASARAAIAASCSGPMRQTSSGSSAARCGSSWTVRGNRRPSVASRSATNAATCLYARYCSSRANSRSRASSSSRSSASSTSPDGSSRAALRSSSVAATTRNSLAWPRSHVPVPTSAARM